jgi:NADH-quinone oxidoreductase subunit J
MMAFLALGAIAIYMLLPREHNSLASFGGLLGICSLAGLLLYFERSVPGSNGTALPLFFYVFAAIMIIGSVMVITSPKPVYSALYFVLVTLAGAGIFVLLLAEFMAIVLIIIYAGAILVTYVFVIMLASQTGKHQGPLYDRVATEPLVATGVSFVLLATVLNALFPPNGVGMPSRPMGAQDAAMVVSMEQSSGELPARAATTQAGIDDGSVMTASSATEPVVAGNAVPTGTQMLGASLYGHYPISLEIGGLLMTIALVGAVVIARKHLEAAAMNALVASPVPGE